MLQTKSKQGKVKPPFLRQKAPDNFYLLNQLTENGQCVSLQVSLCLDQFINLPLHFWYLGKSIGSKDTISFNSEIMHGCLLFGPKRNPRASPSSQRKAHKTKRTKDWAFPYLLWKWQHCKKYLLNDNWPLK